LGSSGQHGGQAMISGSSVDVVQDYLHGTDHLLLGFAPSAVLTGGTQSSFAAAQTAAQGLFNGHVGDREVAILQVGSDSYLFWAADGGGTINSAVQLVGVTASVIGTADFL
jgi:serralysin